MYLKILRMKEQRKDNFLLLQIYWCNVRGIPSINPYLGNVLFYKLYCFKFEWVSEVSLDKWYFVFGFKITVLLQKQDGVTVSTFNSVIETKPKFFSKEIINKLHSTERQKKSNQCITNISITFLNFVTNYCQLKWL